jgi:RNA polymerase sigma factor (sigma-70 family)
MADDRTVRELERFLADRADQLMRTAVLLTGSRDAGQDLLQTALERIVRHWRRLDGDPEAYLRRTLYNLAADGFRRQGRLQRKLLLLRPVTQAPADPTAEVDLRDALVRLLLRLPPRQRAVLVLRYWEQLAPRPRPRRCSAGRKARSNRRPPADCGDFASWPTAGPRPGRPIRANQNSRGYGHEHGC